MFQQWFDSFQQHLCLLKNPRPPFHPHVGVTTTITITAMITTTTNTTTTIITTTTTAFTTTHLEGKYVNGPLVRRAAKPLIPATEVDAVDSRLQMENWILR